MFHILLIILSSYLSLDKVNAIFPNQDNSELYDSMHELWENDQYGYERVIARSNCIEDFWEYMELIPEYIAQYGANESMKSTKSFEEILGTTEEYNLEMKKNRETLSYFMIESFERLIKDISNDEEKNNIIYDLLMKIDENDSLYKHITLI